MTETRKRKPKHMRICPSQRTVNRRKSNAKAAEVLSSMFPDKVSIYELTYTHGNMPQNALRANERLKYFRHKIRIAYSEVDAPAPAMFWCTRYNDKDGWTHIIALDKATGERVDIETVW